MRKRAKGCSECKELNDVLYRCRYGGAKTWIFLCENCLSLIKKKYQVNSIDQILEIANKWSPYRTIATLYLWESLDDDFPN